MESQVNNTSTTITPRSVGVKYGLISALISILFFLILSVSGQNAFDNVWNWIGMVISIAIVVLAHKNFKKNTDGFMSYGQGVGISFWIALVSVLISAIITYCYISFIDPTVMDLFYEVQIEKMSAQGIQDEQIDMAIGWTRTLFWPLYIFMGIFFGVLVGIIVSIFTQKKTQNQHFE